MKVGKDQIALIPFPTNKKFNLLGVKISILSIVGYPEIERGSWGSGSGFQKLRTCLNSFDSDSQFFEHVSETALLY